MKKIFSILAVIAFCQLASAQTNWEWDVRDSTKLTQDEIYAKAKLFIAETWNKPSEVIINDDKESGLILLRGIHIEEMYYQMNNHRWTFGYQIKFQMRDNQWRMVIDDISCTAAGVGVNVWPKLPMDGYPEEKGLRKTSMKEDRYVEIMSSLKSSVQALADRYKATMEAVPVNDDW